MACHVQSALTRTAWTIASVVFVLHLACVARAQETISIWRAGTSHTVAVSKFTDADQTDWFDLSFPPGTSPVRIYPSDHYAWLDGRVVGFKNRWRQLSIQRAMPISAFSIEDPPEGVVIDFEPNRPVIPPGALAFLDWAAIFGDRTTAAMSSQPKRNAQITNFISSTEGVEIKVLTYMKERGSLKINNALELTEVRLENERVPIFRPKLPKSSDDDWHYDIVEEWVEASNGRRLKLWLASGSESDLGAKAFFNGQEITWSGGRNPKWFFDGASLIGVSAYKEKNVLIREAAPSVSVSSKSIPDTSGLQKQFVPPSIIQIDRLATELSLSETKALYIHSVKQEGDVLVIEFSGLEPTKLSEIRYDKPTGTATVRADGWELPVQVEPLAPRGIANSNSPNERSDSIQHVRTTHR